jgi:hypothetical protein
VGIEVTGKVTELPAAQSAIDAALAAASDEDAVRAAKQLPAELVRQLPCQVEGCRSRHRYVMVENPDTPEERRVRLCRRHGDRLYMRQHAPRMAIPKGRRR